MSVVQRAQDAYCTLCGLYGDADAQALMRIRGACCPRVARLAKAMLGTPAAVNAALEYQHLISLGIGYSRLTRAARGNRAVKSLLDAAGGGRRFSPWEIDVAVAVVIAIKEGRRIGICQ